VVLKVAVVEEIGDGEREGVDLDFFLEFFFVLLGARGGVDWKSLVESSSKSPGYW
jgi:hypothetical protein